MYRLRGHTGGSLAARAIGAQATEATIRAGVLNQMTALERPQSVHIARIHEQRGDFHSDSIQAKNAVQYRAINYSVDQFVLKRIQYIKQRPPPRALYKGSVKMAGYLFLLQRRLQCKVCDRRFV